MEINIADQPLSHEFLKTYFVTQEIIRTGYKVALSYK